MKKYLIVITFIIVVCELAYSQKSAVEATEKAVTGNNVVDINQPKITSNCGNRVKVAAAQIRVILNYEPAKDVSFKFVLKAFDSKGNNIKGCFSNDALDLTVSDKTSPAVFEYDLKKFVLNNELQVENVRLVPVNANSVNASIRFEVEYSQSVYFSNPENLKLPPPSVIKPVVDVKNVSLRWEYIFPFTKYEIEILKLHNTSQAIEADGSIVADLDWAKAIRIEYDIIDVLDVNSKVIASHSFSTSINQGTGYYAWRVRPVGSYFESGIGNSDNWGQWSVSDEGVVELKRENLSDGYFYYEDPNQNINYTNLKVFTEENRVKEVQTFADGLNNVRQARTHLSSTNTTIAVQNVNDYSGRQAIQSLPIPIKDERKKYSPVLMSNSAEYSAANFDKKDKLQADKVDNSNAVSYYEGNTNQNIPEAELIPFSQTLYYDDPLNRVKQEGAPGEMMRINNSDDSKNKNKKYFYGVASESELVRLFGVNTPLPNTVNKVIQEDANGVSTISYLGPDDKVLATSLSFSEKGTSAGSLQKLDRIQDGEFQQVHLLNNNDIHEWGYSSSKRFVILSDNTDVTIDYSVNNPSLFADCVKISIDCNYKLEIALFKVDDKNAVRELKSYSVVKITNEKSGLEAPIVQTLSKGTYVVEKRLILGDPSADIEKVTSDVKMLVRPIPELTKTLLYNVTCKKQIPEFQAKLKEIRSYFKSKDLSQMDRILSDGIRPSLKDSVNRFIKKYDDEVNKEGFSFELFYRDGDIYRVLPENSAVNAELVEMRTPCCRVIIPVRWIRRFDTDLYPYIRSSVPGELAQPKDVIEVEDNNGVYDFMPDFEGYAIAYFRDCDALNGTNGSFRQYMNGWEQPGIFNYMIYHMLTDKLKPYVDNSIVEQQKQRGEIVDLKPNEIKSFDCEGKLIDRSWLNGVYDTKTLFNCWESQLKLLASAKGCTDYVLETDFDKNVDVAKKVDEQNNNDKSAFDSSVDKVYDEMNFFTKLFTSKRKLKRKLIKRIRSVSANPAEEGIDVNVEVFDGNIVKGFLDCSGYSFAKIITPYDAKPLNEDLNPNFTYELPNSVKPFKYKLEPGILSSEYFGITSAHRRENTQINSKLVRPDVDFAYVPLADWKASKRDKEGKLEDKNLLPRIKNPIYAFKYFEYAEEGHKETQAFETSYCYTDPNDCYSLDEDNYYAKDEINGGFIKVSCCGVGLSNSVCYTDFKYPNIDALYKPNDPRFTASGDKKARFIVNDFDGDGRIKCPYDHTVWSRGQRYTFYSLLNRMYPKGVDPEAERQREIDDADYMGVEENSEFTYDCNFLKTPQEWYILPDEDGDINSEYPVLIPKSQQSEYPQATTRYNYTMPNGDVKSSISSIEMIVRNQEKGCLSICQEREDEFKLKIREMLSKNCYLIDECRGTGEAYDHIVSSEEIEEMVKALVENCKKQCSLNTFSCTITDLFRGLKDPKDILGGKPNGVKVNFGIGGMPEDDPRIEDYKDGALDAIVSSTIQNSNLIEYDLSKYGEDDFSWYEFTAVEQAKNWDFEVNLPSKCSRLSLFPQRAAEVYNAIRTPWGVAYFSNGDFVRFDDVDFGKGFDMMSVSIKMDNSSVNDGSPFKVRLYIDGNLLGEQLPSGESITFQLPYLVKDIHSVKIEGVGSASASYTLGVVVLNSKSAEGKSNSREFAPVAPNNFIPKEKYENQGNAIIDYYNPNVSSKTVVTPAKNIKVKYNNK